MLAGGGHAATGGKFDCQEAVHKLEQRKGETRLGQERNRGTTTSRALLSLILNFMSGGKLASPGIRRPIAWGFGATVPAGIGKHKIGRPQPSWWFGWAHQTLLCMCVTENKDVHKLSVNVLKFPVSNL